MRIEREGRNAVGMRALVEARYGKDALYEEVAQVYNDVFSNYAWPGGYTILFQDDRGNVLCAACAKRAYVIDQEPVTCDLYNEGPTLTCDVCGLELEASYGDPEEDEK